MLSGIKNWFGFARSVGLIFLALFVVIRVADPAPIQFIRLKLFDFYQVFQPREMTPQPVVIVDIDEESIKAYGQWPWPRTRVAELVTAITRTGGIAMAFDIVFSEPDRLSPHLLAENIPDLDEATLAVLRGAKNNDAVLASAFAASRVIAGQSGTLTPNEENGRGPGQTSIATLGGDPSPYLYNYPGLLRNIEILDKSATGRALFNVLPELGGIVRRVPLLMIADGLILPSLVSELLRVATGSNAILAKVNEAGVKSIVVGGVDVPTDANGQLWVHFTPHDSRRFVSAKDVIEGNARAQGVRGKLVFIGTSAIGLHDLVSTPIDAAVPGVEVHAQVLENILSKSFLKRPNDMLALELVITLLVSIAIIWVAPMFGPVPVFGFGFLVSMGVLAKSWYEFTVNHILLDIGFPLGSSMAIFLVMVFINYFREEAQKRQVRGAFGQYISPDLVEQLAQEPDKLTLGGESKTLTVLFSDVRGFTSISELYKDDPQGLTTLMNRLLTPLSNAIIETNGTIDKYMGDAVMAFWNAPLDDPDHAVHACATGLEMLRKLDELNALRKQECEESGQTYLPLNIGVGANTGGCVVGNMGSDVRFDYSALGDAVNLASRLEGQTKGYSVSFIIGANTAELVEDEFAILELDDIRVKGKTEPERIFAVLGDNETREIKEFKMLQKAFATFLEQYRAMKWKEARKQLTICRKADAGFNLSGLFDLYVARIKILQKTPPPKNWGGIWTMETK